MNEKRKFSTLRFTGRLSIRLVLLCLGLLVPACREKPAAGPANSTPEPDVLTARSWWPAQQNVWTPVGWKDHLFRFNVLYNGALIAHPHPQGREVTEQWAGRDLQLTITPSADSLIPESSGREPYQMSDTPDMGLGLQGWENRAAPVLWTEWRLREGLVLRQEVFAHVPGGKEVETGIEPLFAWLRLSIAAVDEI